jgi:hypothetical protein
MASLLILVLVVVFAVSVQAFPREDVLEFMDRATKSYNAYFLSDKEALMSSLFMDDCKQSAYLAGSWIHGSSAEVLGPFNEMAKEFSLVTIPRIIGSEVNVLDFTFTMTTKKGCVASGVGSATSELTRSADGKLRAKTHSFIFDDMLSASFYKCAAEMQNKESQEL